ncbi:MAG: asparagine synthase (glutamine-hydrolyzing) [Myxococcota bacterium]
MRAKGIAEVCGITGIAGWADADVLRRMTETLAHRGPDGEGTHVGAGWGFGHRRLSIIDIEGGAQPMRSPEGRFFVTFNGEIYNFADLREELEGYGHKFQTRSDTEVLLAAYAQWGDAMLERLNGMFAFALWDDREQRLLLARDRVGIKPLYFAELPQRGALAFGSEPKALLQLPEVSRELDVVALDAYLDLLYVPPPLSMFAGIRQLDPGCKLVWQAGAFTIERYWDARPAINRSWSAEMWAEAVAPVLEDAVLMRTVGDVPVGAFLSGGLDSSTIVAILAENGRTSLDTFCVGYGDEGRTYDERSVARTVAEHFGTRHHELQLDVDLLASLETMVRSFDEPFGSFTALLSWALSKFTRQHVTVSLAGDGGDELFGGYPRYRGMLMSQWAAQLPETALGLAEVAVRGRESSMSRSYRRWARQFLAGVRRPASERYASWVAYSRPEERDHLLSAETTARIEEAGRCDPVPSHFDHASGANIVERAAYADLHGFLPENVLRCSDRMSMAHGLEMRVPLCDHRLVELTMQMPSHHRVGPLATKKILRRIMKGRLPSYVLKRKKLGFNAPLGVWLQRDLDRLVGEWLDPDQLRARGLLRPETVSRLVAEHRAGTRDHGLRLWSLIVVEQWCRLFLD